MKLSLIVAMARNRVIGREGGLPWHLSSDLRNFKRLTMGHPIIMGRRTYESLGRPLPGRTSIVITRQADFRPAGVLVVGNVEDAIAAASSSGEAFVIGGATVFAEVLPLVQRMYITAVQAEVAGDTFFPAVDLAAWDLVEQSWHPPGENDDWPFEFRVYDRIASSGSHGNLSMTSSMENHLLELTQELLQSIASKNWEKYAALCDESLTCFEPEARGHLVAGLEFHKYYFDLAGGGGNRNTTLSSPHVRLIGSEGAVVSYVRLVQYLDGNGQPQTTEIEETRVWQKRDGGWKHVHFHRSHNA